MTRPPAQSTIAPTWVSDNGQVTLYRGDSLEILPMLEAGSVDAVVTDPPYFVPATHYNTRSRTARSLADLSMLEHFYRDVFTGLARVSGSGATWYVFCDGQSYPAFYVCAYPHARKLRPLVWDKCTSFNGYTWRHQHELVLFAELEDTRPVPTGDGDILACRAVKIDERDHLAEKPTELLARLIAKSTQPGDTILDPFIGSGTTAVACVKTGRRCIGIEIDEGYFEIAKQRTIEALMQPRLEGI